jgi:hypothetical protein
LLASPRVPRMNPCPVRGLHCHLISKHMLVTIASMRIVRLTFQCSRVTRCRKWTVSKNVGIMFSILTPSHIGHTHSLSFYFLDITFTHASWYHSEHLLHSVMAFQQYGFNFFQIRYYFIVASCTDVLWTVVGSMNSKIDSLHNALILFAIVFVFWRSFVPIFGLLMPCAEYLISWQFHYTESASTALPVRRERSPFAYWNTGL